MRIMLHEVEMWTSSLHLLFFHIPPMFTLNQQQRYVIQVHRQQEVETG